jgi:hypothetical protein
MTEASNTLRIVSSNDGVSSSNAASRPDAPGRRLTLARRHIETAISHINDVAQSRIPLTTEVEPAPEVDELRLIVRALADIHEALRSTDGPNPLDSTV